MNLASPLLATSVVVLLSSFIVMSDLAILKGSADSMVLKRLHVAVLQEDAKEAIQEFADALDALNGSTIPDDNSSDGLVQDALVRTQNALIERFAGSPDLTCRWRLLCSLDGTIKTYNVELGLTFAIMSDEVQISTVKNFTIALYLTEESVGNDVHNSP